MVVLVAAVFAAVGMSVCLGLAILISPRHMEQTEVRRVNKHLLLLRSAIAALHGADDAKLVSLFSNGSRADQNKFRSVCHFALLELCGLQACDFGDQRISKTLSSGYEMANDSNLVDTLKAADLNYDRERPSVLEDSDDDSIVSSTNVSSVRSDEDLWV